MEKERNAKRLRTADYFKQKKKHLKQFFAVFDRIDDRPVGHLADISSTGMMMISKESVKVGVVLKLRVELPETTKGSGKLTVDARCVWCNQDDDSDCYHTGFEFMMIPPEHVEIIKDLILKFAPVESSQPNSVGR